MRTSVCLASPLVALLLALTASSAPSQNLRWVSLTEAVKRTDDIDDVIDELVDVELSTDFDEQWRTFQSDYGRLYDSPEEENLRKQIFIKNLKRIKIHNNLYLKGLKTFTLGVNEYADLELDEFLRQKTCYTYRNLTADSAGSTFLPPNVNFKVPTSVDWRNKGYVTGVKDQGQCGSCWAFSATGSLEGQNFRKTGNLVSLSEQNLVDCSTSFGNQGCNGGWMDFAFKYVQSNGGIDTEESYPYEARDDQCRYNPATKGGTCSGYVDILRGSESSLQTATATVGPVSVAIDAGHTSFQLYKSGIYNEPQCSSSQLDHGVLVVGYGTNSNGKDYWIVKNSWGGGWGMKGYILMSRNSKNQCGIASAASYPLV